ncbi:MAG TPA: hypothetical protein DEW35_02430 [Ruminococcaceae bacterium]|nr:hypothetical protein [Oscillospiraceae bacterium]
MNNIKYYNDSLAYDFSMFMPREKKEDNIVKMPKAKKRTKAAAKSVSSTVSALLVSAMLLGLLCGNIYFRLKTNELNTKINRTKTQIEALKNEQTTLEVEIERQLSYSNIELEATEMGMRKRDRSQIKYIRVNKNNTVETNDGNTVNSND